MAIKNARESGDGKTRLFNSIIISIALILGSFKAKSIRCFCLRFRAVVNPK